MTSYRGAKLGRSVLGLGLAALLALTACEKGPDRAKVAADLKASVEEQSGDLAGLVRLDVRTQPGRVAGQFDHAGDVLADQFGEEDEGRGDGGGLVGKAVRVRHEGTQLG